MSSARRLCLLAIAASLLLACGESGLRRPPDVLLITVDTLRADHLSSYGFPFETSPEIDALVKDEVLFETALAAAGRTMPSHVSIMTSRYTREHSVGYLNGGSRLSGIPTLADHFRGAGYETAAFVGNVLFTRDTGLERGFDVYDTELDSSEFNRAHVAERQAEATTVRALDWLHQRGDRGERPPFLLWVHYQDPHGPYVPPPGEEGRFEIPREPRDRPLPVADDNEGRGIPAYQTLEGLTWTNEYRSRYADEIFHADYWIGRLMRTFDDQSGSTGIILLTADHGESFGENGRHFVHTYTTTPDVAHVPLILRAPGLSPERRSEVVSHVDILPTLLELAGLPVPEAISGVALGPVLRDGEPLPDRYVYCDNGSQLSAYRDDTFTYLVFAEDAWEVSSAEETTVATRSQPLQWQGDWRGKTWKKIPPQPLPPEIQRYIARVRKMERLPPAEEEFIRQLRSMGYVAE